MRRAVFALLLILLASGGILLVQGQILLPTSKNLPAIADNSAALIKSTSLYQATPAGILDSLTLEEKVGQLLMIGHFKEDYYQHTTHLIQAHSFGGVIIMKVSDSNIKKVPTWTSAWQESSHIPLLISIDQEGGVVSRLRTDDYIQTSQRELSTRAMAHTVGSKRGVELASLGINMNLAPVIDYASNTNSFLYDRSFATTSNSTTFADELIDGHKHAGVIAVPKHFPGHADTDADSHTVLPVVDIEPAAFAKYVQPFTDLLTKERYKAIMTAHVLFPQIDPIYPTTLSSTILTKELRKNIGFDGVIITDDMTMGAITNQWTTDEAAVQAIKAGADMILFAAEPEAAINAKSAIIKAINNGEITEQRINDSIARILELKYSQNSL